MAVQLRPARPGDREGIVAVFLACWRQSYVGVVPQSAIDEMTDDRARVLWSPLLGAVNGTVVVALDEEQLVGVTRYETDDDTGIVQSLYVAPRAHGLGIGSRLLQHAVFAMTADGKRSLTLWVFAGNASSLKFYAGRGWCPDGGSRTQEEFGTPELRLRRTEASP